MFRRLIFTLVLNFILAFSALLYASDSVPVQDKSNKVRIIFKWFHQFQFAGYYAALEKGFYAEEGLDVELLERSRDKGYVESVLDGDAEYGVADSGLLPYRLEGKSVVIVAQIFQHSPLVLIAKADSGIISPYEMIGKRVMFDKTARSDATLQAMLMETIGSVEKIEQVPHSFNNNDLINDKVDVMSSYMTDQPFLFKEQGVDVNIINPQSYGIDFYGDNLFTTKHEVLNDHERVEKVRRATLRGWEYALAHKDELIDIILKKYNSQNISKAHLEFEANMTERMILQDWVPIGTAEEARFEKVANVYKRLGYIKDTKIPDDFIYLKGQAKIRLTLEERRWINRNRNIVLAGSYDWNPYVVADEEGNLSGIDIDFINMINDKTGLNIQIKTASWSEALELAQKGKVDGLITSAVHEERRKYFNFTNSYFDVYKYVFVPTASDLSIRSEDQLNGLKIGISKDNKADYKLVTKYCPDSEIIELESYDEVAESLNDGFCDVFVSGLSAAQYFSEYNKDAPFKAIYAFQNDILPLVYSIRKDWPELVSIINKALDDISLDERLAIKQRWLPVILSFTNFVKLSNAERNYIKTNPVIRLAVEDYYKPKSFIDEKGELLGIDVDYINLISRYLGFDLELVPLPWLEALDAAFKHEVHGIVNADAVEERKKYLNFTDVYSVAPQALIVNKASNIEKWTDCKGLKVATGKDTSHANMIKNKFPEIIVVELGSLAEQLDLLANGKVDAVFDDLVVLSNQIHKQRYSDFKVGFIHYDEIVGQARIGLRNDHPQLLSILNKAIAMISQLDHQVVMNKWLSMQLVRDTSTDEKTKLLKGLTQEEKLWLADNKVIKVATDPIWKPIEYRDSKGNMQGISVEYFKKLSEILGIQFNFIKVDNWVEAIDAVGNKQAHMLSTLLKTKDRAKYLKFTEPYLEFPMAIFTRSDVAYVAGLEQLYGKKVAVVNGYAIEDILVSNYPEIELVLCRNVVEALQKLQTGQVFASINNLAVGTQYIQELSYHNLKVAGETDFDYNLAMAVHKDYAILRDILQKSLDGISENEKKEIFNKWLSVVYEHKFNYKLLFQVVAVILVFVFIVIMWNVRLNQEIKARTKQLNDANLSLAESIERYDQLAKLSSDIVWELDENYVFKYVSDRSIEVIGHHPRDLVGNCCLDFLDPVERQKLKQHFEDKIKSYSLRVPYEYTVPKKYGEGYVILEMFALPLYDAQGNFVGYRGISRDVTERKRSEEMLIQNEKMISVGSLAAGMAHEINNPLGSIMQGVQNVIRRLDKDFAKNSKIASEVNLDMKALDEYLKKRGIWNFLHGLRSSGYRASNIVNNMLQFSRKSTTEKARVSLGTLVDETVALAINDYNLKMKYDFKYVELIKELDNENIMINCVGVEIEQVLLNLLKNAAQALYEQKIEGLEPKIWIRSRSYDKMVEIEVEDNGPGIEDSIKRRIFEPFFTTKPVGKGTGVGLSVSYFIITEKHSGELLVDSTLGKGTKFIIRLPLN